VRKAEPGLITADGGSTGIKKFTGNFPGTSSRDVGRQVRVGIDSMQLVCKDQGVTWKWKRISIQALSVPIVLCAIVAYTRLGAERHAELTTQSAAIR